ncbi:hypothetical protein L6V77_30955, partial [Myxococcota bacterium]|nr:hypothetical protein [Myxococcota bacterium]
VLHPHREKAFALEALGLGHKKLYATHIVNWTVKGGLGGQVNDAAYDWMAATGMNLGVRFSDWGEIHSRGSAGYMAARSGRSHFAFAQIIIGVGLWFGDSSH